MRTDGRRCPRRSERRAEKGLTGPVVSLVLLTSLGAGCVIIVKPEVGGDTPVPVPIACQTNPEVPTAHVFFSLRIERSTANLAGAYDAFMQDTALALAAAGIQTTRAALIRAGEAPNPRPVLAAWGCNLVDPQVLSPSEVILYYAGVDGPPQSADGCAVDPMVQVGETLVDQLTFYPMATPAPSGVRIFGGRPDLVIIVHLDALARRAALEEPACGDALKLTSTEGGRVAWLDYAGDDPTIDTVAHWFVATEERMDRETFVARCRGLDGFPATVLDLMEPSPKALYSPLASEIANVGHPVAQLSQCRMFTEGRDFLATQVPGLAATLGLEVEAADILDVFRNGLPMPDDPEGAIATTPGR